MDTTTTDQSTLEEPTARLHNKIAVCEAITGYSFRDRHLCAEALNRLDGDAALVLKDGEPVRLPKNDRLAVYGDVVATAELCRVWSEQPGASTGERRFLYSIPSWRMFAWEFGAGTDGMCSGLARGQGGYARGKLPQRVGADPRDKRLRLHGT